MKLVTLAVHETYHEIGWEFFWIDEKSSYNFDNCYEFKVQTGQTRSSEVSKN